MCCGGFGGGGGGGGGGGNLLGTLTPDHIPYASGIHTLSDGPLVVDPITGAVSTPSDIQVGADILFDASASAIIVTGGPGAQILLDGTVGQITANFLHVTSDASIDGLLSLGAAGLNVNTGKATIDGATGNMVLAGTLDVKGQLTYEKSTVKRIANPAPAGGGPWTVAIDVAQADCFFIGSGLGGTNTEISNPTNVTALAGFIQTILFRIESSANAADTFSFGTAYHFASGVDPLLAIDWSLPGYYYAGFVYNDNAVQWDYVGTLVGPIN